MRRTVIQQEDLVVVLVSAQAETLRLLDESENNPLRGRKQETRCFACDLCCLASQLRTATPDVHRTPSPTASLLTVNPLAVPYSRASAGNSGWGLSAMTAGPAPESTAATPQRRSIRRYSADAGIAGAR